MRNLAFGREYLFLFYSQNHTSQYWMFLCYKQYMCIWLQNTLRIYKIIVTFPGWDGAALFFSQEDQLINSYVLTLMHCLLLQDTHEDLIFVKSPHIVLKYSPLPGPVKKKQVNKPKKTKPPHCFWREHILVFNNL